MIGAFLRRFLTPLCLAAFGMTLLLVPLILSAKASATDWLSYFTFSEKGVLRIWKEKLHQGRVNYKVIHEPTTGDYIRGVANAAASGIYYEIKYDPKVRPWLSWKWKIERFPKKTLQQNDFAARVYVIFPANTFIFSRCIQYVWDDQLSEGTITKSPLSSRIKVIVARNGKKEGWVQEERNVFQDYLQVFNEEPEDFDDKVGAIAFMTDTDDTKSRSIAAIDEFKIAYQTPLFKK